MERLVLARDTNGEILPPMQIQIGIGDDQKGEWVWGDAFADNSGCSVYNQSVKIHNGCKHSTDAECSQFEVAKRESYGDY